MVQYGAFMPGSIRQEPGVGGAGWTPYQNPQPNYTYNPAAYQQEANALRRPVSYTPSPIPGLTAYPSSSTRSASSSGGLVGRSPSGGAPRLVYSDGGVSASGSSASDMSDADLAALLHPSDVRRGIAAERRRRAGLTNDQEIREWMHSRGLEGSGPMWEALRKNMEARTQTEGDIGVEENADDLAYIASFRRANRQQQLENERADRETQARRDIANEQNQFAREQSAQDRADRQWQLENQIARENWAQTEAARREAFAGGGATGAAAGGAVAGVGAVARAGDQTGVLVHHRPNQGVGIGAVGVRPQSGPAQGPMEAAMANLRPGEQLVVAPTSGGDRYYAYNQQTHTYRDILTNIVFGQPPAGAQSPI